MNKRVAGLLAMGVILYLAALAMGFADVLEKHRTAAMLVFLFGLSFWLAVRVDKLEKRLAGFEGVQSVDGPEFLRKVRDYHLGRFPKLRERLSPIEAAEELAVALSTERPALERVLVFSMWMSREFVRDVAGITDSELEGLKDRLAETRFWPVPSMTIEQWDTHTAVFDHSGYRRTIYHHSGDEAHWPSVLWQHALGDAAAGTSRESSLEVVLWNREIRCWARGGRFRGKYWSRESEDEYAFITIPLEEPRLNDFLRPDDDESVEAPYRYESKPWDKQYSGEREDQHTGWSLHVVDYLAYVRR